ncbi:recombinase RecT [Paracoccus hibiscisoli]|uniref:Recombinase RecT n=1 Tax=Paracoccus hibiscisoli TaxID=2023261 RepID=A0A4U0QUJ3_9RHOB|nr:recombinase RecT [Paracoccus hibiscisoli]TJZ85799.1 hypothetical protein FA740_05210 [Paracoccus hibiscisoli]
MNQIARPSAGTSISAKPLRQVANVRELLVNDQAKQQLAAVAAGHMRPERMLRLMANAMRTTPQLGECDPLSLLGAMMTCASLGVEANTPLGHAYLIPFKNNRKNITEVQLILGYKGMIDLARRSGHIVNIHGDVVYEGDEFSFEYGSEQHLKHRPKGKRVNPIYAYCHAKLTDGEAFVVLPWDEVMAIRDGSQGYKTAVKYNKKDSPWIAHQHEMAAKTAVRALFKYLPISIEMDGGKLGDALSIDDQQVDFSQFAQNPEGGYEVEGEAEEHDPETGEVGGDPVIEDQRATQQTIEPEREREPARRQTRAKVEDKPAPRRQASNEPAQQEQTGLDLSQPAGGTESLTDLLQRTEDEIKFSLDDGEDIEATLEMFAARLETIKKADASEHDALVEYLRKYAADRA